MNGLRIAIVVVLLVLAVALAAQAAPVRALDAVPDDNDILLIPHAWRGAASASPDRLPGFAIDFSVLTPRFTLTDDNSVLDRAGWLSAPGQDHDSAPPGVEITTDF